MSSEIYYTGVGSRKTPYSARPYLVDVAKYLSERGVVLRSGGAAGADSYFQAGAESMWYVLESPWNTSHGKGYKAPELYLPWVGFGDFLDNEDYYAGEPPYRLIPLDEIESDLVCRAAQIASEIHPAWNKLTDAGKKLHTRNIFQVLGRDLQTPSSFLACYAETNNGKVSGTPIGGTRTAWCLAKEHNIECFNMAFSSDRTKLVRFLQFFF